ncbi:hypothetical protein [Mesotoga prima]|uniref:hypothetical protein n=1 Tax=Mesotoga prima TaxID=1184387 RepID=UPI002FDA73D6
MRKYEKLDEDTFRKILTEKVFKDRKKSVADVINSRKPVVKDIKKIFGEEPIVNADYDNGLGINGITGMVKLHNFIFLGIEAQTKLSYPVYMILYVARYDTDWDDDNIIRTANIRAYVPENGNTFNPETRRPYSLSKTPKGLQCNHDMLITDIAKHFYEWWQNYTPIFERIE